MRLVRWREGAPVAAAIGASLLGSCGLPERTLDEAPEPPFACETDAQCALGICHKDGFCVEELEAPPALLLQVAPRSSDPIYGGAQFVDFADDSDTFVVPARANFQGAITARQGQQACLGAATTVPVKLRLTPRVARLGLNVPSYELRSSPEPTEGGRVTHRFERLIPEGRYDIYLEPDESQIPDPSCTFIPRIFRDRRVPSFESLDSETPRELVVTLPWRAKRTGWTLDMIHAVTGERMSNRVTVPGSDPAEVKLTYLPVATRQDYSSTGDERIRLNPPEGADAATLLPSLAGLTLLQPPGQGALPSFPEFGRAVEFEGWMGANGRADQPVPGRVVFTALNLAELRPEGLKFSFHREVAVGVDGRVRARLLPGTYRVRAFPPVSSGYAATESTLEVLLEAANATQAGQVIPVSPTKYISGNLESNGLPLANSGVFSHPSHLTRSPCELGQDAQLQEDCPRAQSQLLKTAFGEDSPRPRARTALSDSSGRFELALDCGDCGPTASQAGGRPSDGALLELQIRPPAQTKLAWSVSPAINVSEEHEMLARTFEPPWARELVLELGENGPPIRGALVRAYYLLDKEGQVMGADEARRSSYCLDSRPNPFEPCILAAVQVGEQRSDEEGRLLLLLPSTLH